MMAKLSNVRAMVQDDVRRIRMRFNQALEAGYSTSEASAHANSDAVLVPKLKPSAPTISESGPTKVRDTKPLGLSGKRPPPEDVDLIPVFVEEVPPAMTMSEQVQKAYELPPATTLDPKPVTKTASRVPIPQGWQDLPWPQLQKLAETISGEEVKSRKQANKIIDRANR